MDRALHLQSGRVLRRISVPLREKAVSVTVNAVLVLAGSVEGECLNP